MQDVMTLDELIEEYETNMDIKLSQRERFIFAYAFSVGQGRLYYKEDDPYIIEINLGGDTNGGESEA